MPREIARRGRIDHALEQRLRGRGEAGVAVGRGRPVVVWGRRENILMHHPAVRAFDQLADAVAAVGTTAGVPA